MTDKLFKLHVAWNDEYGNPDRLTHVEFGDDCELCAVETDVLDGDPVFVARNAFDIYKTEMHRQRRLGRRFRFVDRIVTIGNIHWDMLLMHPEEFGRFAEWIQKQRHWSLNVAATEFWNTWGSLSADQFVEMFLENS